MVLKNTHCSNRRKFDTYRNMDKLHASTPIVALPVLSKEAGEQASERVRSAQMDLYRSMGLTQGEPTEALDETISREILDIAVGGELIDIEDLLRNKDNG